MEDNDSGIKLKRDILDEKIDEFVFVNNHMIDNKMVPEFKQIDGKILIKHFIGTNTDNFILKKSSGSQFKFSIFKINNIYYININDYHIIDYKKFTKIEQIIEEYGEIKVRNKEFGEIVIPNCELDLFKKGLDIMDHFIKSRTSFWKDLFYSIVM